MMYLSDFFCFEKYDVDSCISEILKAGTKNSGYKLRLKTQAIKPRGLRSLSRNFMADIRISLRNIGGQSMQW